MPLPAGVAPSPSGASAFSHAVDLVCSLDALELDGPWRGERSGRVPPGAPLDGSRHHDLAANCLLGNAGSEGNVLAEVIAVFADRPARMETDAHPQRFALPPGAVERLLQCHGALDAGQRLWEGDHEPV